MTQTAQPTRITVQQVAGRIGAEISGVDLREELDDVTVAEIRQAVLTHRVVFFRGQDIDHAQHIAFGRRFGSLTRRPGRKHGVHSEGHPEILTVDPKADTERYGADFEEHYRRKWVSPLAGWHSDLTEAVNPPGRRRDRPASSPSSSRGSRCAPGRTRLARPRPRRRLRPEDRPEPSDLAGRRDPPARTPVRWRAAG
ncbi:TauD/TfdA dioxygenase family protein [Streptomyces sp. NPDC002867]